jgi:hypothetical protein
MADTMGPNDGAKNHYIVQPEWRGRVYINNNYCCNCPFKVIPDYMADEKNSVTDLRVAPPSARFAGYLSLLWRYTQLQYIAHQSLGGNSNFERLALPLSPLCR